MRKFGFALSALVFVTVATASTTMFSEPAAAQATCRNKCNDEEQACLSRTGNKGQCGNRAKECAAKCK